MTAHQQQPELFPVLLVIMLAVFSATAFIEDHNFLGIVFAILCLGIIGLSDKNMFKGE